MVEEKDLRWAIQALLDNHVGDYVYDIRERELKGWAGPRVTAWGKACAILREYMATGKDQESR